jgi:hypothetical protein
VNNDTPKERKPALALSVFVFASAITDILPECVIDAGLRPSEVCVFLAVQEYRGIDTKGAAALLLRGQLILCCRQNLTNAPAWI